MKHPPIAIIHYHLDRGGVTRVIEAASSCLTRAGIEHRILCGSLPERSSKLPISVIPELAYDEKRQRATTGLKIVRLMRAAMREAFGTSRVIWHFHNHSIGKNRALCDAVGILAKSGAPMVLQYHDFAEDGRPAAYPTIAECDTLYPTAPQILHAFINSRDRNNLIAAGLPKEQSALLPNAVRPPARVSPPARRPRHPLVLYPVRGIRRKNLGELFLLAAVAPKGTRFAVSLEPANQRWKPAHDEWVAFAADSGLPVILNAVGRVAPAPKKPKTFASWVRHSTHFVTTSVAEGFGLGFLEPATIGKPLFGRNLPMVTDDFANEGICPGRLYERLLIPESWVGLETLRQRLVRQQRVTLESYGLAMSNQHLERSFSAMRHRRHLDFGNLPESLQRQVLQRLLIGEESDQVLAQTGRTTTPLRKWLADSLAITETEVQPDQLEPYTTRAYTGRLEGLYTQVDESKADTPRFLKKHQVLGEFVKPGSFHFLRT